MKYTIVIDSVGCLPEKEIVSRGIKVLPLKVSFEDIKYNDTFEEKALLAIHKAGRINVKAKALSHTSTQADIQDFILKNVALESDLAICQTIGVGFTPIYPAYKLVATSVAAEAKKVRASHDITTPFRMTSMDTGSLAAGQGLIAMYSDDLLKSGISYADFVPIIEDVKTKVRSFNIIKDTVFMRHRSMQKGNKTVSLPVAMLANALDISPIANNQNSLIDIIDLKVRGFDTAVERVLTFCADQVTEGLVAPLVNISYAGDPAMLEKYNGFKRLRHACNANGVALYLAVMSLAATINLGPGAMSISIAPNDQTLMP